MKHQKRMKAAFFGDLPDRLHQVFYPANRQRIEKLTDCYPKVITSSNFSEHAPRLKDIEVMFSTWGMPLLRPEQIDLLPSLKAIFFGAGSVQGFAQPYLQRGVLVFSGWAANAIPVAEFTLAQILLSNKGYFRNSALSRNRKDEDRPFVGPGNYGEWVSILGAGQIGRRVIKLLQPFHLNICVFDPFLKEEVAAELKVTLVSLDEAFKRGYVVSNHLANLPPTRKMLKGVHFSSMRKDATFINTGRPQTVDQTELVQVLTDRPDLTALLDVYHYPEEEGKRLHELQNVHLSTHIAGSRQDEQRRMGDWMLEEFITWSETNQSRFQVSLEMLATMA